jgi:hypothetical protein
MDHQTRSKEQTMRSLSLAALALAAATSAPALAQDNWEQVGTRIINARAERDTLFVFGSDRHRQIRVCATGQPLSLLTMQIVYANGDTQDLNPQIIVQPGQCTEAMDLTGRRRTMERIVVTYMPIPQGGTAPRVRIDAQ